MLVKLDVESCGIMVVVKLLDIEIGAGRLSVVLILPNVGIRVRVAVKVIPSWLTDILGTELITAPGLLDVDNKAGMSMDVVPVLTADGVETVLGTSSIPLVFDA